MWYCFFNSTCKLCFCICSNAMCFCFWVSCFRPCPGRASVRRSRPCEDVLDGGTRHIAASSKWWGTKVCVRATPSPNAMPYQTLHANVLWSEWLLIIRQPHHCTMLLFTYYMLTLQLCVYGIAITRLVVHHLFKKIIDITFSTFESNNVPSSSTCHIGHEIEIINFFC